MHISSACIRRLDITFAVSVCINTRLGIYSQLCEQHLLQTGLDIEMLALRVCKIVHSSKHRIFYSLRLCIIHHFQHSTSSIVSAVFMYKSIFMYIHWYSCTVFMCIIWCSFKLSCFPPPAILAPMPPLVQCADLLSYVTVLKPIMCSWLFLSVDDSEIAWQCLMTTLAAICCRSSSRLQKPVGTLCWCTIPV